jgi:hypothetical protein
VLLNRRHHISEPQKSPGTAARDGSTSLPEHPTCASVPIKGSPVGVDVVKSLPGVQGCIDVNGSTERQTMQNQR